MFLIRCFGDEPAPIPGRRGNHAAYPFDVGFLEYVVDFHEAERLVANHSIYRGWQRVRVVGGDAMLIQFNFNGTDIETHYPTVCAALEALLAFPMGTLSEEECMAIGKADSLSEAGYCR